MRGRWPTRHPAEGATFLGALVALALILALAGAAGPLVMGAAGALARAEALGTGAARAVLVQDLLLRAAARVRPPFWAPAADLARVGEGKALSIAWLDGVPGARLELRVEGDALVVDAGGDRVRIGGLGAVVVGTLEGTDGTPRGLVVSFEAGGRDYEAAAAFGSFGLSAGGPAR